MVYFEISTTKYEENIKLLQVAMTKMAAVCNVTVGFKFGDPVSRFGWTFFHLIIEQELYIEIIGKFSDMIKKCKGRKQDEKFTEFISHYFESRGCNVKIKMAKD